MFGIFRYHRISEKENRCLTPAADVFATDSGLIVLIDMPGADRNSIWMDIRGNRLAAGGEISHWKHGKRLFRECPCSSYYRRFILSAPVERGGVRAEISDGVLTLIIDKQKPGQSELRIVHEQK